MKSAKWVAQQIIAGRRDIYNIKKEAAKRFNERFLKNSEVLPYLPDNLKHLLVKKPARTKSGIASVAIMIPPEDSCKHNCVYCPYTGKAPRSYTGYEPNALRARAHNFDPYEQAYTRIQDYLNIGHSAEKCEVIIMGGTFLEKPKPFKEWFIKRVYDGINQKTMPSLQEAQLYNETAKHRVIGLTLETRPDVCFEQEIDEALFYGATRMELGVQHPNDEIYKIIKRGHKVSDVIRATKLLKDSAFKVLYHLMPALPGSNPKKDIAMFKEVFSNPDFKPDMLKIYPTLVMQNTELYRMMEKGEYKPYDAELAAEVIARAYTYIPKWVRVMRIQRDIPANLIDKGVKKSNLRQLVEQKVKELGIEIKEIRARELHKIKDPNKLQLEIIEYKASKGKEFFVSYEAEGKIAGFARYRIPEKSHRPEITEHSLLLRELHVYGQETPIGKTGDVQHLGIGRKLLQKGEELAKEHSLDEIVVISGVGVREYYRKFGYKRKGPYMAKNI